MQMHGHNPMQHVPLQTHPRMNFMPPHGWTFMDPNHFFQQQQYNKLRNMNNQGTLLLKFNA